jgi:drug/metabolite transporter (DMT)-like permease
MGKLSPTGLTRDLWIYAGLFFGMAFFGSGTPAAKFVTERFPILFAPFARLLLAAVLTLPVLYVLRAELKKLSKKDWWMIAGIGGIGLVLFSIFLLSGMKMVNGVVGAVVMSMSPAAMAVGANLFMPDTLGWRKITAVVCAVAGVLIINVSGKAIQATGWTLVFGSALVFGAVCSQTAYSLFAKRVSKDVNPIIIVPLAAWVAVILLAIPGIYQASSFDFSTPTANEWFALAWRGIGPFAIGTSIWFYALQKVKASTASGFMGAMPASALVLSYLWLGDKFHWIHLVGFALVFASIGLVVWAHRTMEKQQEQQGS